MQRPRLVLLVALLALSLSACAFQDVNTKPTPAKTSQKAATKAPEKPSEPALFTHNNLNSTLWVQTSAEYRALALQTYAAATDRLDRAIKNKSWTASPEQQTQNVKKLKPAVILDVDETVLDNSPYQARMVLDGASFDKDTWAQWCHEVNADPIPGALAFTKAAHDKGVTVFYVTNRPSDLEEVTRQNLEKLGFPLKDKEDVILTKGEKKGWGSPKGSRRELIGEKYRIIMLVGDNLGDFVDDYKTDKSKRFDVVKEHKDWWGERWFMLPNPTYGSWWNYGILEREKDPRKANKRAKEALNPKR